jgi:nitroreductase
MKDAYDRSWFIEAPVILVVCADPSVAWIRSDGEPYWKVDAAIAMQNMILQATAEGLGTCWIGAFDEAAAKRILNIPGDIRVVAMTPLGYPDEVKGKVANRKAINDILHTDKW